MRASLRSITFKDFVTLQRGFDLPRKKRNPGEYPVVASTTIADYHYEYKVEPPGVVTGRSGSLGEVQYITEPFWPLNTALWVKDFKGNLPRYVYYFLQTLELERFNSGAGVPTLNRNDLDTLEISIHGLEDQRKIAAVLSAYDDLIENNTRRIAILEEMAQAIYREWFVHFRFPGHEQVTMVDSELGPIPEGWEVARFSDTVTLLRRGVTPSRSPDEVFAHYSFPAFDSACMPLPERGETIRSGKYLVDGGNVLLSKLNPHIPRVWLPFPDSSHRAIASSEFLVLLPEKPFTRSYLYSLCQSADFLGHFASLTLGTSTSHQRVKPQDFLGMATVLPPSILIDALTDLVEPMFRAINLARLKNAALRRTRDLLLPRLISGEVDVSDLEINMGGPD